MFEIFILALVLVSSNLWLGNKSMSAFIFISKTDTL